MMIVPVNVVVKVVPSYVNPIVVMNQQNVNYVMVYRIVIVYLVTGVMAKIANKVSLYLN